MARESFQRDMAKSSELRQQRGLDIEQRRLDVETNRAGEQSAQQAAQQKQGLLQSVIQLNASGSLDDASLQGVNDWLRSDEHFGQTGIQISKPTNPTGKGRGESAVVNALKQAEMYKQQAAQSEDPAEQQQFNQYATMLEGWVKHAGSFAPAQGFVTTKVTPETNPLTGKPTGGSITNTTTKTPITSPATTQLAPQQDNEIQSAKQAIMGGKDPNAVKARYKQRTGKDFPE